MSRSIAADAPRGRRERWFADAVIAGFVATGVATVVLVVAYNAAAAIGVEEGGGLFRRWLWELTHNEVVSFSRAAPGLAIMLHLVFGLFWAGVYAYWLEYRLPGSGWRSGMVFGLIPYAVSLFALLPAAGVGLLEWALSAGPLPVVGNLVLHLVYGGVLGQLYDASADQPALAEDARYDEPLERAAVAHSEQLGAAGILAGAAAGALLGLGLALLLPPTLPGEAFSGWSLVLAGSGLLAGGAVGAVVGSFAGLPGATRDPTDDDAPRPDLLEHTALPFLIPAAVILLAAATVTAIGLALLSLAPASRLLPVYVALGLTALIALGAWLLASAQSSRPSNRDTVSHSGH